MIDRYGRIYNIQQLFSSDSYDPFFTVQAQEILSYRISLVIAEREERMELLISEAIKNDKHKRRPIGPQRAARNRCKR
jgi:hypothetical protein